MPTELEVHLARAVIELVQTVWAMRPPDLELVKARCNLSVIQAIADEEPDAD